MILINEHTKSTELSLEVIFDKRMNLDRDKTKHSIEWVRKVGIFEKLLKLDFIEWLWKFLYVQFNKVKINHRRYLFWSMLWNHNALERALFIAIIFELMPLWVGTQLNKALDEGFFPRVRSWMLWYFQTGMLTMWSLMAFRNFTSKTTRYLQEWKE